MDPAGYAVPDRGRQPLFEGLHAGFAAAQASSLPPIVRLGASGQSPAFSKHPCMGSAKKSSFVPIDCGEVARCRNDGRKTDVRMNPAGAAAGS